MTGGQGDAGQPSGHEGHARCESGRAQGPVREGQHRRTGIHRSDPGGAGGLAQANGNIPGPAT